MLARTSRLVGSGVRSMSVLASTPKKLFINGEFVDSVSGKTFETFNPATEEKLADVAEADAADVDIAVSAARAAFDTGVWRKTSPAARSRLMHKFADLIEENADDLALLESLDNGKPVSVARNVDIALAIACYRYYAGWADKLQGKTIPIESGFLAFTRHEPVGVAGQIIPWNFPILMQAWKLGPALACGNTVVMKQAEQTPLTALRIAELAAEAGYPAGVLNVLPGFGPTAGAALARHEGVDKVAFTGSTEVGYDIQRMAGETNLKRISLELGGKSANIIFPDVDMDAAIAWSQLGLFLNQGQCCIAGSRLIVHEDIYDEFVEKSIAAASAAVVGDPTDPATTQGPQVSKAQFDKIMGYIETAKAEGATLGTGGARAGDKGYFVEPTVFSDVTDDMTIASEEIFGPVMSILKFKDTEDAIARANNSAYGLGCGVMSNSFENCMAVANGVRAGTVYVNCYDIFDAATPFGGFKDSGLGRELGEYGLHAYTETKTIICKTAEGHPLY